MTSYHQYVHSILSFKIPANHCCKLGQLSSMEKTSFIVGGVVLFIKRHGLARIYPNAAVNYPIKFL